MTWELFSQCIPKKFSWAFSKTSYNHWQNRSKSKIAWSHSSFLCSFWETGLLRLSIPVTFHTYNHPSVSSLSSQLQMVININTSNLLKLYVELPHTTKNTHVQSSHSFTTVKKIQNITATCRVWNEKNLWHFQSGISFIKVIP